MDQESNNKKQLLTTLAVLLVIVVIVGGVVVTTKKDPQSSIANGAQTSNSTTNTDTTSAPGSYKDGSYTAVGSYVSPGGNEDITINVTLKSGVVTDTSAKSGANDPQGEEFQSQFIAGYKSIVVGKNIDNVQLSHVSGSSLTSQGFNNAIQKIRSEAQS